MRFEDLAELLAFLRRHADVATASESPSSKIAKAAENRAAFPSRSAGRGCGLVDAIGHPAERQRLQPHAAGPGQHGEEQAFPAEERRLDLADVLDVVTHRRLQRDETSGVHAQRLSRSQLERMHRAAGVHEAEAVALQLLHDEAFAAEQADADPPLERDADRDAARRAQERVLLTDQRAAQLLQIHRQDLAGIGRGERDLLLAAAADW